MGLTGYEKHLNNLPVGPDLAAKVLTLAEKRDFSYATLEKLIAVDPSLTAKILRIANSSQFARQHEVKQLQTAMTLVGLNTIKNLVILLTGQSLLRKSDSGRFYNLFWKRSILSAFLAKDLAELSGNKEKSEQAFVAALLRNLGQVALFQSSPQSYETMVVHAWKEGTGLVAAEGAAFGTTHKVVGSNVLSHWNFPAVYSATALEHGNANITSEHKQVIILVSTASFLVSRWDLRDLKSLPLTYLQPYVPFLGIDLSELQALDTSYLETVSKNPLYVQCREMYGF